jgi:hypothetical protein
MVKRNDHVFAYELARDPGERRAFFVRPQGDRLNGDLVQTLRSMSEDLQKNAASEALRHHLDEATKEKLRALGYQS